MRARTRQPNDAIAASGRRARFRARLHNFRRDCARWGVRRALVLRVMARSASWLCVSYVVERDLRATVSRPHGRDDIDVRLVEPHELVRYAEDAALHLSPGFVRDAVARGDLCVGAFDGERLVAFVWQSFGPTPHTGDVTFRFAKPYRYGYHAFTHPAFRGLHLHERIAPLTDHLCIARGYTHGIGFIEIGNYASIAAFARAGNVSVGLTGYLRLFGRVVTFRTPGATRRGIGFERAPVS